MVSTTVASICLAWYIFIVTVSLVGFVQLIQKYSSVPPRAISSTLLLSRTPQVTVIRPVKGLEPYLYKCLAATFHQDYPVSKLTVHLCIPSRSDPAFRVLEDLIAAFPKSTTRIFVEDEDPALIQSENAAPSGLGPNPKIRNMSRGYREAKGDVVWILDCNVWVDRSSCGRMVDSLYGFSKPGAVLHPYKFVHQLPIVIAVSDPPPSNPKDHQLAANGTVQSRPPPQSKSSSFSLSNLLPSGSDLEEMFMSTSHAKFYTAINTAAIAPCILGKSNMFRRSHLNYLTSKTRGSGSTTAEQRRGGVETNHPDNVEPLIHSSTPGEGEGIDFFSHNICEDHLIGDILWRNHLQTPSPSPSPSSSSHPPKLRNHYLLPSPLAIQPLVPLAMPLGSYIARRIRWLRVRKFTVPLATLVEPGTEAFLATAIGVFGAGAIWGWSPVGMVEIWVGAVGVWMGIDRVVYNLLQSGRTVDYEGFNAVASQNQLSSSGSALPAFLPPPPVPKSREGPHTRPNKYTHKPLTLWILSWLGRETLALPIWIWAFWGGVTVVWRDKRFWVGLDMKVHEIVDREDERGEKVEGRGRERGKGKPKERNRDERGKED